MAKTIEYEAWNDVSDGLELCPKETAEAIESFLRQQGHDTITKYLDAGKSPKVLQAMFRKTPPGTIESMQASSIITNEEAQLMELRGIEPRHAEGLAPLLRSGYPRRHTQSPTHTGTNTHTHTHTGGTTHSARR